MENNQAKNMDKSWRLNHGYNMDISSNFGDTVGLGNGRCGWQLDPHIAGHCHHPGIAQNYRRA